VEATRLLKPLVQRVARRLGERAGRNVSERRTMQEPTRPESWEGRSGWNRTSEQIPFDLPGCRSKKKKMSEEGLSSRMVLK
jgi:hypothetical protein